MSCGKILMQFAKKCIYSGHPLKRSLSSKATPLIKPYFRDNQILQNCPPREVTSLVVVQELLTLPEHLSLPPVFLVGFVLLNP